MPRLFLTPCWILVGLAFFSLGQVLAASPSDRGKAWKADDSGYKSTVVPFVAKYCSECHAGPKSKGNFHTDSGLVNQFVEPAARQEWNRVVDVLNGHQMPPKEAVQPKLAEVGQVVDWITAETVRAELNRRDRAVVLRRMNREEYRNTIRDLIGVDFDTSNFPQDPPAGGFDNNGAALTMSPLHVEIYMTAARRILDRALVAGERPRSIKWRLFPKHTPMDSHRVRLDDQNNPIVNGGNNPMDGKWVVVHNNAWDKVVESRGFHVPSAGTYAIRLRAAGRVPLRDDVIASASKLLKQRQEEQDKENPKRKIDHAEDYERTLEHFRKNRNYDYGPPRVKLVLQLGPMPRTVAEFDIDATESDPKVFERRAWFTTEEAGVRFEYAYSIPAFLENFWFQNKVEFARPEMLVDWFEIEGPLFDRWPPLSHETLLFDAPEKAKNERAYAEKVLSRFMTKAYRGPVTRDEVDSKRKLFDLARKDRAFLEAIKLPLAAILSSPNFLYLVEPVDGEDGPKPLGDFELASRLSYFLWSSMPDSELSLLAEKGKLKGRENRLAQVERMLADPKAEALVHNFAGQWLGLREIGANPPAPDLYPEYDRHLESSIVEESERFFREILKNNLDARNLVKSDFVVINERLGRFYGIEGVRGDNFRKVKVPEGVHRGGITTQAAMLTLTSNGTRTSPVKRGTWVLKNLLGTDPGLPVSNVGEIAPKIPGIEKATVRKRLEIHRQLDQCARCHNKIDPLGFALENYNAAGEWRDQEGFGYKGRIEKNDPKIDASSVMPDGKPIVGVEGLQDAILAQEDRFLSCLASKLITYALGRELGLADQPMIKAAVSGMKKNHATISSLVKFIVTSEAFETK